MIGKDWYRYLAATNQRIVEARRRVGKQKDCIKKSKQEGRTTAALVVRLRSLEDALQDLTIRRERILQRVRSQPLPVVDHCGAVVTPISHIHCTAIEGLPPDIVHLLHKSLVGIGLMRMSIELAHIQLKRSHRALRETDELLERVCKDGF